MLRATRSERYAGRSAPCRGRQPPVAARSRAARAASSAPGSSLNDQLPPSVPGVFIRASLPEPEQVLRRDDREPRASTRARTRRAASAARSRGFPSPRRPGRRARAARRRRSPTSLRRCRCRACPCRRRGSPASPSGSWSAGSRNANWSTTVPGSPSRSRRRRTAGVITPRSSAISGSVPSSTAAASNTSRPGPRRQRPCRAVSAPSGTAQNATKPRKWSMRATSTSANVRRKRSIHQR